LRSQLRLTIFVLGQRGASASAIALMARQNAPEAVPSSLFICSSSGVWQAEPPSFGEICRN